MVAVPMSEKRLSNEIGALLWRRVYEAHAELAVAVTLNTDTLRTLLEQAGIPEPDDDVILWNGKAYHGRNLRRVVSNGCHR